MSDQMATALEDAEGLDGPAGRLADLAERVLPDGAARALLEGEPLGHPLHPLLTDLPIGFWTSASVLDVVGGRGARRAASALVGLGVATAVPTVASGLAELRTLDERRRRVAVVHAGSNVVATVLYWRSWSVRHRGHYARGAALALLGATVATVGGYLGGHLAFGGDDSDDAAPPTGPPTGTDRR